MRREIAAAAAAALSVGLGVSGPVARADSSPDFAQAAELYKQAEAEMQNGDFGNAVRDYTAAYDLTKDPVLFFKIGSANDRAGECAEAIRWFRRYLAEANPNAHYTLVTKERIDSCGGKVDTSASAGAGSAGAGSAAPSVVAPATAAPVAVATTIVPPATTHAGHGRDAAWITLAGSVALATTGVVLAFAASSSENDVRDLYQPVGNSPPPQFDPTTQRRYQQLIDEGHRYEYLSWTSFGLAAIAGGAAAYLFVEHPAEREEHARARVVPVVTPQSVGAAATLRF